VHAMWVASYISGELERGWVRSVFDSFAHQSQQSAWQGCLPCRMLPAGWHVCYKAAVLERRGIKQSAMAMYCPPLLREGCTHDVVRQCAWSDPISRLPRGGAE
jgi:hypothetical protein